MLSLMLMYLQVRNKFFLFFVCYDIHNCIYRDASIHVCRRSGGQLVAFKRDSAIFDAILAPLYDTLLPPIVHDLQSINMTFLVDYLIFHQLFLTFLDNVCRKMKEAMSPPHQLTLHVYAEFEAIRLATVITPPRRSRSKHYDLRILPFMDIEAEECNVRVCNNKENNK